MTDIYYIEWFKYFPYPIHSPKYQIRFLRATVRLILKTYWHTHNTIPSVMYIFIGARRVVERTCTTFSFIESAKAETIILHAMQSMALDDGDDDTPTAWDTWKQITESWGDKSRGRYSYDFS